MIIGPTTHQIPCQPARRPRMAASPAPVVLQAGARISSKIAPARPRETISSPWPGLLTEPLTSAIPSPTLVIHLLLRLLLLLPCSTACRSLGAIGLYCTICPLVHSPTFQTMQRAFTSARASARSASKLRSVSLQQQRFAHKVCTVVETSTDSIGGLTSGVGSQVRC